MQKNHINTNGGDFVYKNTSSKGQNVFMVCVGGDGNINTSQVTEGNNKYYNAGNAGVNVQVFLNNTLIENIAGGGGNIRSLADQYIHVRTDRWREKYSCGFLGLKTCWRDKSRDIWEWGHRVQKHTRAQAGATKSFVLNLAPNAELRVKFVGHSSSANKGRVSISVLDNIISIPLTIEQKYML